MKAALAILRRVPPLAWACLALVLLLAAADMRIADLKAEVAEAKAATAEVGKDFATYRETQERQARQALEALARDNAITAKKRQEAADAEHLARKAAEADAARLRQSAGQLQRYATDLATSLGDRARDTAAASSCPAAERARQLAFVVGALDDFAAGAVEAADATRRAGQLCERTYEALTP